MAHALDRHLALIGFMGAGKTTLGSRVADLIGRRFFDLDREIEKSTRRSIPDLFRREGEPGFQGARGGETLRTLKRERPAVVALGGGAIETPAIREALREHALTVLVDVEVDACGPGRPVGEAARDRPGAVPAALRAAEDRTTRRPTHAPATSTTSSSRGSAFGSSRSPTRRGRAARGSPALELHLLELHEVHEVREKSIEEAATLDRAGHLPGRDDRRLRRRDDDRPRRLRRGHVHAGRAVDCGADTLVGQVDAGIGGKTAVDLREGKNLAGAFHYPRRS